MSRPQKTCTMPSVVRVRVRVRVRASPNPNLDDAERG